MEKIHAKIHQRQEVAIKWERAMAYSLTHQWQASSRQIHLRDLKLMKPIGVGIGWNTGRSDHESLYKKLVEKHSEGTVGQGIKQKLGEARGL